MRDVVVNGVLGGVARRRWSVESLEDSDLRVGLIERGSEIPENAKAIEGWRWWDASRLAA